MPDWSNEVPDDPRGLALPIRRTPPHGALLAVVTSIDLIGTRTHFWQRRTMPHEKINCEACKAGIPTRWHSYLSAWDHHTKMHFLFELTAQAAQHFVTFRKAHGTLRGCLFKASRWRQIPNGRVLIECKPYDIVSHPIPKGPDLIAVLSILWNLPPDQMNTDAGDAGQATAVVDVTPNDKWIEKIKQRAQSPGNNKPTDKTKSL